MSTIFTETKQLSINGKFQRGGFRYTFKYFMRRKFRLQIMMAFIGTATGLA